MSIESIIKKKKKTIRFKVIKPVYETLIVKTEDDIDISLPITGSQRVYDLFKFLIAETKEHFFTIHLDSKNKIIAIELISTGSMNANIVHPREVFKSCLMSSAVALVCIHNHPSGVPEPSSEDYEITRRLNEAANMLGIRLLDHVIIGDGAYVSFADRGLLETSTSTWPKIIKA
jgi:DNA repair protein RadC